MKEIYDIDCSLCERLVDYRRQLRVIMPEGHNAPVASFGLLSARLLVVGLAPGRMGANRTGRPFTGDYAGDLLYKVLGNYGFLRGVYGGCADDGVELVDCRITNAVKCVPPENKPLGSEIVHCRDYLRAEIAAMENLRVILCLGRISHESVLRILGVRLSEYRFSHCGEHDFGRFRLLDSYHCSRYNVNTGRLSESMFSDVFVRIRGILDDG